MPALWVEMVHLRFVDILARLEGKVTPAGQFCTLFKCSKRYDENEDIKCQTVATPLLASLINRVGYYCPCGQSWQKGGKTWDRKNGEERAVSGIPIFDENLQLGLRAESRTDVICFRNVFEHHKMLKTLRPRKKALHRQYVDREKCFSKSIMWKTLYTYLSRCKRMAWKGSLHYPQ